MTRLMSIAEVCNKTGLSGRQVRRYIEKGILNSVIKPNDKNRKVYYVSEGSVNGLIENVLNKKKSGHMDLLMDMSTTPPEQTVTFTETTKEMKLPDLLMKKIDLKPIIDELDGRFEERFTELKNILMDARPDVHKTSGQSSQELGDVEILIEMLQTLPDKINKQLQEELEKERSEKKKLEGYILKMDSLISTLKRRFDEEKSLRIKLEKKLLG